MAFHDVSLPGSIQYGSQFGAGFATVVQQTASGHEDRIARQASPRHRFRLREMLKDADELAELKTFILARRGALHSFRLKDWSDYTTNENGTGAVTNLDAILGTGDGSNQQFQLVKGYDESGLGELDRVITLPVAGTITVAVAGVGQTLGVDYTVTNPGGVITFAGGSIPTFGQVVTAGCEFDVPARFSMSVDEWQQLRSDAYNVWSLTDIECVEVLNEVEYPELWFAGGATNWRNTSIDITLAFSQGELHLFDPGAAINVFLPAPPTLFPGGPRIFVLNNAAGASTITVRDDAGTSITTLSGGNTVRIGAVVASGSITWLAY